PIEMSVLAVGYQLNGQVKHGLTQRPPLNLDPVELVTNPNDMRNFTDNLGYLRLILRAVGSPVPVDQLLVAHITSAYALRGNDQDWAVEVVNELIELLRSNYDVLIPTLEALSDALPSLGIGNLVIE
ncbi:MAG: hypothetical protein KC445_05225, partial [Anaerolineales bacterium]|nr:hypothetical protein [Anaerolineales bacterium]